MKEFVCRDTRQVFVRIGGNRGRVRVFHATAASSFANVQNEGVAFEWRSAHELQFILADTLQVFLNLFLFPVVTVYYNPNLWLNPCQFKLVEFACLDGSVDERIVTCGITAKTSSPTH